MNNRKRELILWMGGDRGNRWLGLAVAVMVAGCGDSGPGPAAGGEKPGAPGAAAVSTQAVAVASSTAMPAAPRWSGQKLVGRWQRRDGGYVVDVRAVDDATGKMDVSYLNPRPIHVAQAQSKDEGGKLTVFVELQDVGYPGATYRLTHVPAADQLIGVYYQPSVDQSFDVEFVRMR